MALLLTWGLTALGAAQQIVPVDRAYSVNTYDFQPTHDGVGKVSERAQEQSKRAKRNAVERVREVRRASERK